MNGSSGNWQPSTSRWPLSRHMYRRSNSHANPHLHSRRGFTFCTHVAVGKEGAAALECKNGQQAVAIKGLGDLQAGRWGGVAGLAGKLTSLSSSFSSSSIQR